MSNHTPSSSCSSSCFFLENTDGSLYPSDLLINTMDDSSSSSTNTNGNLSSLSSPLSNQSFDLSKSQMTFPCCVFRCKPNSHPFQERCIPMNEQVKVGRALARLKALPNNAIFDCKVLSRQHAKIWYEQGKFLLQDTKSSNGTFVNNQRLGKCNEESQPYEIYSGDIIQFGVDVTENNRKTTHNCIILEVRLFHLDGNEGLYRNANGHLSPHTKEADVSSQVLYQLAQYLQEAMYREQKLEQKLEYLQGVLRNAQQTSNDSWQAIINEDRLLARINALEDQLQVYRTKNTDEDSIKQELTQLTESHVKFEEESKKRLEKVVLDRADAISHNKSLEISLIQIQDELKRYEELTEKQKEEAQQLLQSVDEQRLLMSEVKTQLRDSENRCTELDNEKQRIQSDFDEYYQRTHHLQEIQEKTMPNGTMHDQDQDMIEYNGNPIELPIIQENGELEKHPEGTLSSNPNDSIVNHDHREKHDNTHEHMSNNTVNGIDSIDELLEAQKEIASLRDQLNGTIERLTSTEDLYHAEQQRYRALASECDFIRNDISQLKVRFNKEKDESDSLIQEQQMKLEDLSKSILSKQTRHDQRLSVYTSFFLCCYLLIFFLFFFLL